MLESPNMLLFHGNVNRIHDDTTVKNIRLITDLVSRLGYNHDSIDPDSEHIIYPPLPVGVGFQLFDGDLQLSARIVSQYRPCAAWLFVPRANEGQLDLERWTLALRRAHSTIKIWIQVGSVADAVKAIASPEREKRADVLVLQGSDAGGHGLKRGAGVVSLVPEVIQRLREMDRGDVPVLGAGGISDGRGVAGVLGMGAAGVVMGTRFLAAKEADVNQGYRDDILQTEDGGQSTTRTTLFDRMVGRFDWPEDYDGRAIVNMSLVESGLGEIGEQRIKERFDENGEREKVEGLGLQGRTTRYVGTGVGLVRSVNGAADIVRNMRSAAKECLRRALVDVD